MDWGCALVHLLHLSGIVNYPSLCVLYGPAFINLPFKLCKNKAKKKIKVTKDGTKEEIATFITDTWNSAVKMKLKSRACFNTLQETL